MKIISKFHDYYDNAFANVADYDDSLIYHRKSEEFRYNANDPALAKFSKQLEILNKLPSAISNTSNYRYRAVLVCFCGKAYPYLYRHNYSDDAHLEMRDTVSYDKLQEINKEIRKPQEPFVFRKHEWWMRQEKYTKDFYNELTGTELPIESFHALNAPLYCIRVENFFSKNVHVITNISLKEIEFFKKVDTFSTYQEIEMFLGSVLAVEDNAPRNVGGDLVSIKNHGFDEFSFRNMAPGQKKINRAINKAKKRGGN